MNKIEFLIYKTVSKNQKLKRLLRNIYQGLFDILPRKKDYFISEPVFFEKSFFGFHDISPLSYSDDKLLSYRLEFDKRMPESSESLEFGYYNLHSMEFVSLGNTLAWNYHKGSRLQWLDKDNVIINDRLDTDSFCSKIININTKNIITIDYPIDSINRNNYFASSFDYIRLQNCMPGYGYTLYKKRQIEFAPDDDGLYLLDLKHNTRNLLVSLKTLASEINLLDGYYHFVTHTEFSHNGEYIAFLHRWISATETDLDNRFSRLIIYDLRTHSYFSIPTDFVISHYVWNDNNQIIVYCSINGKRGHYIISFDEKTKEVTTKFCDNNQINGDGHQTVLSNSVFFTDTYPDKYRMAHIYSYNIDNNQVKEIVRIYSPKDFQTNNIYCHIACDLHPRISISKKYLTFDCIHNGMRSLALLKIEENLWN